MSILESMFYGLISGFAEFLPVSSQAHQIIARYLMGARSAAPIRELLVHIAMIIALCIANRVTLLRLNRERRFAIRSRRRKTQATRGFYEYRLLKTAAVPMLIAMSMGLFVGNFDSSVLWIALFFVINGVLLIVTDHLPHGNKGARKMSMLDNMMLGLISVVSIFPGISRIAAMHGFAIWRGADKQESLNWVLILSLPALLLLCVLDIVAIFTVGIGAISFTALIGYVFAAVFAGVGSYLGIILVRFLIVRSSFSTFAYYSWGAALFVLMLYLIA